ncbi:EF-hand domain-containing protein [Maribacter sp. 2308TA10-17]|uniref:EF-hand domain-containing protein n=1 Tax=Maribacter sp. 2308TA10-17 TaxID=3386276 RepID=UPI0039BCB23F
MKNNTFKTVVLVFGFALLFFNSSFGQSQNRQERRKPPTFEEMIEQMDANEDGKLSKEELKGPLKDNFDKVDLDEDGFITAEEFEKAPRPKRRERRN